MTMLKFWTLFCVLVATNDCLTLKEIKDRFKKTPCIPAYVVANGDSIDILEDSYVEEKPYQTLGEVLSEKQAQTKLARLHELADFNGIQYKYTVIKEDGPAHKKEFTVELKLGVEEYIGVGDSLKNAQKDAAIKALEETVLKHPNHNPANDVTPTVLLNNIASQLGLEVKYEFINPFINLASQTTEVKPRKSYIQKMNETIDAKSHIPESMEEPNKGPFTVIVTLGNEEFIGTAYTKQDAKHKAATTALESIQVNNMQEDSACFKDEYGVECKIAKDAVKNAVSKIYEAARKHKWIVSFDIVEETGEPHKRQYTAELKLGEFVSYGRGRSKKAAKRDAAENMMIILPELTTNKEIKVDSYDDNERNKPKKKKKRNKFRNRVKVEKGNFFSNIFGSVLDFIMPGDEVEEHEDDNNGDQNNGKPQNDKSMQMTLLDFANSKHFEVNFMDLTTKKTDTNEKTDNKLEKSYVLLSMSINPTVLCLGEGINQKSAREVVSLLGLKMLNTLGILDAYMENVVVLQNNPREIPEESMTVILSPTPVKRMK